MKYQSKNIVGKLTVTEQSLVFTSLSLTVSINFQDITRFTKCLKGIMVDQFIFKVIMKERVFKEILGRIVAFRTTVKRQHRSSSTLSSRPSIIITRDRRSSTSSSSRTTPVLRLSTSFGEERYTWVTVERNQIKMDFQEFFYEIQANPPTIMMPSDSSNSKLVVTKKSRWIPYAELIQAKKITKDISYDVQQAEDLHKEEIVSKLMVKTSYDSRLIFYLVYEIPTQPNAPKLKVYIKLKAKEVSENVLKFKIEYDVEFGDLSMDQLLTKLNIQQQIKNHFDQIFLLEDTNLESIPESAPSSESLLPSAEPTFMFWIPQIKKIEAHQGVLLIIWLAVVGGLVSSILMQRDLKRRSSVL